MNHNSSNHLSAEDLKQLVAGDHQNLPTMQTHLGTCHTCQSRLVELTAEPWWWNEGYQLVSSSIELIDHSSTIPTQLLETARFNPLTAELEELTKEFSAPIHPELLGQIDEYEVHSLIGVGGMGAVFKGFDRELNRPIAIKFLLPRHAISGLSRQRFSREAQAVAAVRNENVIPVFRIHAASQYPYFVMPLISGLSLDQLVQTSGPLEPIQIVRIACQIAAGLAAAHDQGLIHRDVKPANILLEDSCNRVVVTDFGLARDENNLSLTQTGMIAGTPQYMSPEQADGKILDNRSDLFCVGSVIYWMATARAPFDGTSQLDLLKNIREQRHQDVRSLNPSIPATLAQTVDRLLEKDPSDRFQSAHELERFLTQYSAHLVDPTQHDAPKLKPRKRLKTWQLVAIICLIGAPLLVILVSLAFLTPPKLRKVLNRLQPTPNHQIERENEENPQAFLTSPAVLKASTFSELSYKA